MNKVELGLYFENKAIDKLRELGYELVEHTSQTRGINVYDIIMKKDGQLYFIEVKGRSGNNKDFKVRTEQMRAYIYIDNVWIFLINDEEYRFFPIIDSDNLDNLRGFNLYTSMDANMFREHKSNFGRIMEQYKDFPTLTKVLHRLGDKLIAIFYPDDQECYGLLEGDRIEILDDFLIQDEANKKEVNKK
jgi:Holliday junction resolvase-like predicted endonuclease